MAGAIGALDEAIKEYLLFRGFMVTLKQFELDKRDDRDKGLRANRVVDQILQCVYKSDLNTLQSFWTHLNKRFFARLTHESLSTVYRLENNILRMFLVNACKQGKHETIREFFEKMSDALQDRRDWKDWFALLFTKNPEHHPSFKLYFSKEWQETFVITLHNFFSTLFTTLPLPTLLNFEAEHQKMEVLVTENRHLHNQLAATRSTLAEMESNVQRLEARLAQQVAIQATAASKRRHTSGVARPPNKLPGPTKMRGKASSFATPTKKLAEDTSENLEKPESSHKRERSPFVSSLTSPQKEMSPQAKLRQLSLEALNDVQEQTDLDLASPSSVVDEGCVKSHVGDDGSTPFLPVSQETYKGHSTPITHCKFSPNATQVASVGTNGVMRIWDPSTLDTSATIELRSTLLSLDWVSQSDSLVLIGSDDGVVKLFDSCTSKYHWEVSSDSKYPRILSIACSPSSSMVAFSAAAGTGIHREHSGSRMTFGLTSSSLPSHRTFPNASELQPLSKELGVPQGGVFIWDLKTRKQKCSLPLSPMPVGVNYMSFNHNSNLLVTGGADGMVRLYDVFQQECLFGWKAHDGDVYNVQFSSDETSVYTMGKDRKFCQWSVMKSGEKITDFKVHVDACQPAAGWAQSGGAQYYPSRPRGDLFAFESEDKFVLTCAPHQAIIYQVGMEGALTKTLSITGHSGPVTCVDWLQGRRSFSTCVTGSVDCSIKVTNLLKNVQTL